MNILSFIYLFILYCNITLTPEAIGNILKGAIVTKTVKALVGGWRLQSTKMLDIRTYLDVVEVRLPNNRRYTKTSTIPRYLKLRIGLVDVLCQLVDTYWIRITAHERQTGNIGTITLYKGINCIRIQRHTNVIPEIMAMASRAATWTVGDIDG